MGKREQMKKYFKRFPKWMVILGVVSVVGVPLVIIWWLVSWRNKPADALVDGWIEEDLQRLEKIALEKTGLDESELVSETVTLTGLRFWNIGGADIGIRSGKDDIIRFTPLGVTVINFTEHQLIAYQCALDLTTGNPLSESTDEYFYRDVVSVSTQTESMTWDKAMLSSSGLAKTPLASLMKHGKLQFNAADKFVLTTSGGTSIEVVISDPTLIKSVGGGSIPTERADKAIRVVRKMLREKKAV